MLSLLLIVVWGVKGDYPYFNNETDECDPGIWGINCTEKCDPNCDVEKENCDKETGACPNCIDTYYTSPDDPRICLKCKEECKDKCDSTTG